MSICIICEMSICIIREMSICIIREMSICIIREMSICIIREMSICFTRVTPICIAREMSFYAQEMKNSQYVDEGTCDCQDGCETRYPIQNAYNFKLLLLHGMTIIHVVLLHLFLPPARSLKFTHKAFFVLKAKYTIC